MCSTESIQECYANAFVTEHVRYICTEQSYIVHKTRKRQKENDGSKLVLQFYLTSYNRVTCMGVCRHVSAIALDRLFQVRV